MEIGPPRISSGTTGGVISKNWYSICSLKTFPTGRHFYYTSELLLWNPAEIYDSHKAAAAALSNASTRLGCDLLALESRMSLCLQLFQLTTTPSQVQTAAHRDVQCQRNRNKGFWLLSERNTRYTLLLLPDPPRTHVLWSRCIKSWYVWDRKSIWPEPCLPRKHCYHDLIIMALFCFPPLLFL